jgi:hypothetical protein
MVFLLLPRTLSESSKAAIDKNIQSRLKPNSNNNNTNNSNSIGDGGSGFSGAAADNNGNTGSGLFSSAMMDVLLSDDDPVLVGVREERKDLQGRLAAQVVPVRSEPGRVCLCQQDRPIYENTYAHMLC